MSRDCTDIYVKFHSCLFAHSFKGLAHYPNDECKELEKKFLKCERNYKVEKKESYDYKLFNEYLSVVEELRVDK